jgi:hypothetical protein
MLYPIGNMFLRAIKYFAYILKTNMIWKRYECLKFWNNKSPNFGIPFGSLEEKWHLDIIPT